MHTLCKVSQFSDYHTCKKSAKNSSMAQALCSVDKTMPVLPSVKNGKTKLHLRLLASNVQFS